MRTPNFTDPQFLDASGVGGLNSVMAALSGSIAQVVSGLAPIPGLLCPEAMTYGVTGFAVNVNLPMPWGLLASGGTVINAHGVNTGQDTQAYSVNFSGLVPASGAGNAFAWLAVSATTLQQNPFPIPGPPIGNPSWNPNFVPTIGYALNVDTVNVFATTTLPDNINVFGLFVTTLNSGSTGFIGGTNTSIQQRAGNLKNCPYAPVGGGLLTPAQANYMLVPFGGSQSNTLPAAALSTGLCFDFVNTLSGSWTISASGSDYFAVGSGTAASVTIAQGNCLTVWTPGGGPWYIAASTPPSVTSPISGVAGNPSYMKIPLANGQVLILNWGQTAINIGVSSVVVALPQPFPNAYLTGQISDTGYNTYPYGIQPTGTSGVQLFAPVWSFNQAASAAVGGARPGVATANWWALGY